MAHTEHSKPSVNLGSRDKSVGWYSESIGTKIGDPARKLLETYSRIPPDQVEKHILAIVRLLSLHATKYKLTFLTARRSLGSLALPLYRPI